jgi:polar amino acid transport system substrate-binding protein
LNNREPAMATIRKSGRIALGAVTVMALTLSVSACTGGPQEVKTPSGITVELVDPDHLTTCTNLPYAPFQYTKDGKVVGFDVEIVDLAAKKLGIKQDIVDIKFDSIKSGAAMTGGSCDLAAAGMTITPEREKNLTFSDPYFDEVIAFLAPKGTKIDSIDQVSSEKMKLGVQAATTSLAYATEHGLDPEQYEDSGKQLQALQSGTVDVILQDLPVINEWLKKDDIADKYELGAVVQTGEQYGFGFKKGADPELVKVVNEALAEAREDGSYDEIYEKWFGTAPEPA